MITKTTHNPGSQRVATTGGYRNVTSMQPSATRTRDLQGFEIVLAQLGVTDLIVGEVSGDIDIDALRRAAFWCSCRHPGLRSAITWPNGRRQRPRFEFFPPALDKVVVREFKAKDDPRGGRPFWQHITEVEAAHVFNVEAGYMFRVTWVPYGKGGGHVIVSAQHAVVDGVSLMRLLHELLDACASIQTRTHGDRQSISPSFLPPSPAVLSSVRRRMMDRFQTTFARMYILRQQRKFQRDSPFPITAPWSGRPRTHCWFGTGNTENWQRVREECRARGVTVGGAFAAAVQFASVQFIHEQTGRIGAKYGALRFPMSMDYSLRRLIPGAAFTQSDIGLFTGVADIGIRVRQNIGLWTLAKKLTRSSQKQLELGTPLLFQRAVDGFLDIDRVTARHRIDYAATAGVASGVNLSNVGQFPYTSEYLPFRLERVYGCNGAMRGGPLLTFWLRSINDHFCYNAVSATPAIAADDADRLFARASNLMESCGVSGSSELRLAEYIGT